MFREQLGATSRGAKVPETVEENRPETVPPAVADHQSAEHIQREVCRRERDRRAAQNRRRRRKRRRGARNHRHRAGQDTEIGEFNVRGRCFVFIKTSTKFCTSWAFTYLPTNRTFSFRSLQ